MQEYNEKGFLNVGTGEDLTIRDLAAIVQRTVGFAGEVQWNTEKPDGTPRKLMDVSKLHQLGWKHRIGLESGIQSVYEEFKSKSIGELRAK